MYQPLCELFSILYSDEEYPYLPFMDDESATLWLVQGGGRIQNHTSVSAVRLFWPRKILFIPPLSIPPPTFSFDSCMRMNLFPLFYWQMNIFKKILDSFITWCLFHMMGIVAEKMPFQIKLHLILL